MPGVAKIFLKELKKAINKKLNKIDKGEQTNLYELKFSVEGKTETVRLEKKERNLKLVKLCLAFTLLNLLFLDLKEVINLF